MEVDWFDLVWSYGDGEPAAVKCGPCSEEISVRSIRQYGMTREKGKIE